MTPSGRRVVITGMGVVSPSGSDLHELWANLTSGYSPVRVISRFDASGYPSRIAAEVPDDALDDADAPADLRDRGRIARFAALAVEKALASSGLLASGTPRERVGLVLGTGLGTYGHAEVFSSCAAGTPDRNGAIDPALFNAILRATLDPLSGERRTPGSISARLAARHGLSGPVLSVMTACAAGTQAIGDGLRWIRLGRADAVVAGAADSEIYPMGLASFCLLGALSRRNGEPTRASRPFDAGRDGFVLGEGAGALVLEEREHALRRGARVFAEVAGFGSACDAFRVTDPHPEATGAVLAMRRALADARLSPDDVDYVNAHGTSTPAGDRVEALALGKVFGDRSRRLPVSSTKSMIGHLTVAAGAVEAIVTALTLVHQTIHPTINQEVPDPACGLDTVPNVARSAPVRAALSNSFAFGGQTAALALVRHEA